MAFVGTNQGWKVAAKRQDIVLNCAAKEPFLGIGYKNILNRASCQVKWQKILHFVLILKGTQIWFFHFFIFYCAGREEEAQLTA